MAVPTPPTSQLAKVCVQAGLGELRSAEFLPIGLMNRTWRVETNAGTFAVKQLLEISAEQALAQQDLLRSLAAAGIAVPQPQSVQMLTGKSFSIHSWVPGKHLTCTEMSLPQCVELGALLRRVHGALAALMPEPGEASIPNPEPAETVAYIGKLLSLIEARGTQDDIDTIARANLLWRNRLVPQIAHLRPESRWHGPSGWVHGDFHYNNVLWHNNAVSAIVDWDRVKVQPLALEVIRMCLITFQRDDGSLDLTRIAAFVSGYRPAQPLAAAVHRMWWYWLNAFWPLDWRYERGDTSCDHLFVRNERMLRWWTDHRPDVIAAFS